MSVVAHLFHCFNLCDIIIDDKNKYNIIFEITNFIKLYPNKQTHISLLIDCKTRLILTFALNYYYVNTNTYPYSVHSEVNCLTKYLQKKINKNKKELFIFKLSKTGLIGESRPCKNCARFIFNNIDNLKLINIYHSTPKKIIKIDKNIFKNKVLNNEFKFSNGITKNK